METFEFREVTNVLTVRKDIKLKKGDKNQFEFVIDIPSIDETSFMPKYLTTCEELLVESWSPTCSGASFKVRYYIYTRLFFDNIPIEKSQRVKNEVRIFKRPEFIYSQQPSGYESQDPFTYLNGATRRVILDSEDSLKHKFEKEGGNDRQDILKLGGHEVIESSNDTNSDKKKKKKRSKVSFSKESRR